MNYMVCYAKDAVKSENHKKPYFFCFHISFVLDIYMCSKCGSHDVKKESFFTNGRLFLCAVVMFLCYFYSFFFFNSAAKIRA